MRTTIPSSVRKFVIERAGHCCEYCRLHEDDSFLPFEVDRIVSLKHGGGNEPGNLAYTCPHCTQHKGTDLVTFLSNYQDIVPLFNPRTEVWRTCFWVENGVIYPQTRSAEATIKLLKLNEPERIIQRQILMEIGAYPA